MGAGDGGMEFRLCKTGYEDHMTRPGGRIQPAGLAFDICVLS